MKNRFFALSVTIAAPSICAVADDFNYELRGGFSSSSIESSSSFMSMRTDSDIDRDEFNGGFSWFFDGLSDDTGPRSEAVFTDRASFVSVGAFTGSQDLRVTSELLEPFGREQDVTGLSIAGRYVLRNSRWFFGGNYRSSSVDDSIFGSRDTDQAGITVGKYIGETTSIELALGRSETSTNLAGISDTGVGLQFRHIGNTFADWQYGLDLSVSTQVLEDSSGSYRANFALYPTRDLKVSLDVTGQIDPRSTKATRYALQGGWFINPKLELQDGLRTTRLDEPASVTTDDDGFFVSARYRF